MVTWLDCLVELLSGDSTLKNVILHLGSHKTGSTSIQVSLERSRDSLESSGVFLPPKIPTYLKTNTDEYSTALNLRALGNFADFAYYLRASGHSQSKKNVKELISNELGVQDMTTLIISAEDFATLNENEVKTFKTLFLGDDIKFHLIYFLRNQSESLVGIYQTGLEHFPHVIKDFETFVSAQKQFFEYDVIIERWDSIFKFTSINLLDYSDAHTGSRIDSVKEFEKIVSQILKAQINLETVEVFNRGMGTMTMRWLDQLHPHLKTSSRESVIQILASLDPKSETQIQFLTLKEFDDIGNDFLSTNKNILKRYKINLNKSNTANRHTLFEVRPDLGDLIGQLVVSKGAAIKTLAASPLLTVIQDEPTFSNPYIDLDLETIKKSVEISLESSQVIGKKYVQKFPPAAERQRDNSNEKSDINTHIQQLDRIIQENDSAQRVLHLGCKWGYMTRLLFSLGNAVEIHASDLDNNWVKTTKLNTPFAQSFFLNSDCELPFRNEFADMVVANHSFISYLDAKKLNVYLKEISRVLTSEGRFFFNSISLRKRKSEVIDPNPKTSECTEQNGEHFLFNEVYLEIQLPPELQLLSFVTNSHFDFYVLEKRANNQ